MGHSKTRDPFVDPSPELQAAFTALVGAIQSEQQRIAPPPPAPILAGSLPRVGSIWHEERGIFLGIMPGNSKALDGRDYALILPTSDRANLGRWAWGEPGKDISGANSDTDGATNTQAMAAAGNALAKEVIGMEVDGFSDLYIPARHEARLAYLIAAEQFDRDHSHWTSTQALPYYAWGHSFNGGDQGAITKEYESIVRLMRRIYL